MKDLFNTITQPIVDYSLHISIALAVFTLMFAAYTVVYAYRKQLGFAIIFSIATPLSAVASYSYLVQPISPWLLVGIMAIDIVLLIAMADQLVMRRLHKNYD